MPHLWVMYLQLPAYQIAEKNSKILRAKHERSCHSSPGLESSESWSLSAWGCGYPLRWSILLQAFNQGLVGISDLHIVRRKNTRTGLHYIISNLEKDRDGHSFAIVCQVWLSKEPDGLWLPDLHQGWKLSQCTVSGDASSPENRLVGGCR